MRKTETEIVEAHKTTIEALTGKRCKIVLVSKEDELLQTKTLADIEKAAQAFNYNFNSIFDKGNFEDLVNLRKIFCLLASNGNSKNIIARYSGLTVETVSYYLRRGRNHMKNDPDFKHLFEQIKKKLFEAIEG